MIADRSWHASRPRQAQCPERLDIYFRVDARGVMALVPRQLTSFLPGTAERLEDLFMRGERWPHRRLDRARLAKH